MKGIIDTKGRKTIVMYAEPSVKSEELAELENKDVVDATAKKGDWLQVSYMGVAGWVKMENVIISGQIGGIWDNIKSIFTGKTANAATSIAASAITPMTASAISETKAGKTMIVNTAKDPLTLRSTPSTSGTKIASIAKGQTVVVAQDSTTAADGYNWVKVNYNGQTGYVAGEYLSETATDNKTDIAPTSDDINTNNNNKTEKNMGLSENAMKYVKYGAIAAVAAGGIYLAYKLMKGGKNEQKKALNGVSRKRKKFKKLALK